MLQLVQPGQGTEDTRRVALVEEISHPLEGEKTFSRLQGDNANVFLYHLADKRLIVTGTNEEGKQTIEVVHEALIREWKRLKEWMSADREFRVWQEKVRYAEKEWSAGNREEGLLLRGSNLLTASEWYANRKKDLGIREIEYIERSQSRARRNKILYWTAGTIIAGLIVGFGLFGMLMFFNAKAERERAEEQAKIAEAQAKIAERSKQEALIAKQEMEKKKEEAEAAKRDAELKKEEAEREREKAETAKREAEDANQHASEEKNKATREKQKSEELLQKQEKVYKQIASGFNLKPEEMENAEKESNWSDYEGKANYEKARVYCQKAGGRLPKEGEMKIARNKEITKNWEPVGFYWTLSKKEYSAFSTKNGELKNFTKEDTNHFRCIRGGK